MCMEKDKKGDIHWVISMTANCFYRQKTTLSRGKFLGVLLTQILFVSGIGFQNVKTSET